MKTFAYVDGFNLYNRALIGTPHKWLDLRLLITNCLRPENQLVSIKYYTARVTGRRDPGQPSRQDIYLRALKVIPEMEIYYGRFLEKTIRRPLVEPIAGVPNYVEVRTTEEKGSDVNLASHLVRDACVGNFEVAVVVSKDTDLTEPIRIVTQDLNKTVGVICPDGKCPQDLKNVASFVRHLNQSILQKSQFPESIPTPSGGTITKPSLW